LFERIQAGEMDVPGVLPETYDDLDRLGLRGFFQRMLPDFLATEVALAADAVTDRDPELVYLLVDRWFPDILAYTMVESEDDDLHRDVGELCLSRYDDTFRHLERFATLIKMLNVFVPLASCKFLGKGQEEKFRATCDRELWENTCLSNWNTAARNRKALFVVTKSPRRARVNLILDRLREAPIHRLPRPTASDRSKEV
jgi:hypothetical protein